MHLIEDITSLIGGEFLEEVSGTLFVDCLQNVRSVMWIDTGQFLPRLVVRIEVVLGLIRFPARQLADG